MIKYLVHYRRVICNIGHVGALWVHSWHHKLIWQSKWKSPLVQQKSHSSASYLSKFLEWVIACSCLETDINILKICRNVNLKQVNRLLVILPLLFALFSYKLVWADDDPASPSVRDKKDGFCEMAWHGAYPTIYGQNTQVALVGLRRQQIHNAIPALRPLSELDREFDCALNVVYTVHCHQGRLWFSVSARSVESIAEQRRSSGFHCCTTLQESLADAKVSARQQCVYEGL